MRWIGSLKNHALDWEPEKTNEWPRIRHRSICQRVWENYKLLAFMSRFFNKKKHSTPEIPAWSPTAVLIGPNGAWLRSSDGIRYIHHGMIEWWDLGFCDVCRAENEKNFVQKKKIGSIKKKLFKKKNLVPEKKKLCKWKKTFDTQDSRVVPHHSTDQAQWCLTSQFEWDAVYPPWCDRMMRCMVFSST